MNRPPHAHVRRRTLLAGGATLFAWPHALPAASLSGVATAERRMLVIVLRGGLDGLAALPALGDPAHAALRGALGEARPLDAMFGLNPRLEHLRAMYDRGEALLLHAVATPYRGRSHFEGQDMLEAGAPALAALGRTGWLNRALEHLPRGERLAPAPGLATAATMPLLMRGAAPVETWQPQALPLADPDTIARLLRRYEAGDAVLAEALRRGAALDAMGEGASARNGVPAALQAASFAAGMMSRADVPRIAALSLDGWDTHLGQGFAAGLVAERLALLDRVIQTLREGFGAAWAHSAVLILTEFGRTAAVNATAGTDHGTGGVAFLIGGAVRGGRVLADWPGLAPEQLHEGRDLRATLDLRALLKGCLAEHLGVERATLDEVVFPGSRGVAPLGGLLRGA
jgi:uncharacterized protein (DUF1501 family)